MIKIINANDPSLVKLLVREEENREEIRAAVAAIIAKVRARGDAELIALTAEFDGVSLAADSLEVSAQEIQAAKNLVDADFLDALRVAVDRITAFHRRQLQNSWFDTSPDGTITGQLVRPLERVGIYVPGGKASYPSSVLMNAIPAKVAGVGEIIMVSPPGKSGRVDPHALVAAELAGVDRVFRVGGAQAVAALAYGTRTIPRVDKITGPGNIYVTLAKQQVYGLVDIDMLAGPSEVLIVADDTADPVFVAADLLSQAEHDQMASAILITPAKELAKAVYAEVNAQATNLPRQDIIKKALADYGAIILTDTLAEALRLANEFAPEHLELVVAEPFNWLGAIKNAGSVFLGEYSSESVGDYLAGPNHILPTGGTARFYSPVGVDTFLKKMGLVSFSRSAMKQFGQHVERLARAEGLSAHANSVSVRLQKIEKEGQQKNG